MHGALALLASLISAVAAVIAIHQWADSAATSDIALVALVFADVVVFGRLAGPGQALDAAGDAVLAFAAGTWLPITGRSCRRRRCRAAVGGLGERQVRDAGTVGIVLKETAAVAGQALDEARDADLDMLRTPCWP